MGLAHRNYKSLIAIRLRLNYQNCFIQKYCIVVYLKDLLFLYKDNSQAKRKYRGMFETQKSENKTRSGEICLDIRTHASPKVGQDQVSGGVSVLFWQTAPVAHVLWKPHTIR